MVGGHRSASLFTSSHYPVNVLDVVTANEFHKSPREYHDRAPRRPLTLTKHGRRHLRIDIEVDDPIEIEE